MGRFTREPLFFAGPRGEHGPKHADENLKNFEPLHDVRPIAPDVRAKEMTDDQDHTETETNAAPGSDHAKDDHHAMKSAGDGASERADADHTNDRHAGDAQDAPAPDHRDETEPGERPATAWRDHAEAKLADDDIGSEGGNDKEAMPEENVEHHKHSGQPEHPSDVGDRDARHAELEQPKIPEEESDGGKELEDDAEKPDEAQEPVYDDGPAGSKITPSFGEEYLGLPTIYVEDFPQEFQDGSEDGDLLDFFL